METKGNNQILNFKYMKKVILFFVAAVGLIVTSCKKEKDVKGCYECRTVGGDLTLPNECNTTKSELFEKYKNGRLGTFNGHRHFTNRDEVDTLCRLKP